MNFKSLSFATALLFLTTIGWAQQDVQYTQFMHNKLAFNPAYAGSSGVPCMNVLHRSQWNGFEGAPVSQSIGFQMPLFKERVGFGISIVHDQLGPTNSWNASMIYSYHVDFGKSKLGIGVQGSMRNYRVNWDETEATHLGDGTIPTSPSGSKFLPNFGAGLYLHSPRYYVGLSVPHFLKSQLSLVDNQFELSDINREELHGFLMAGMVFDLNSNLKLKPAALVKYAKNSPLDFDLHASLIFFDKLWLGATYRGGGDLFNSAGESIDAVLQLQLSESIRLGLAYDFTLTKIRDYTSGSYEIMLDYCFHYQGKRLTNPRFF